MNQEEFMKNLILMGQTAILPFYIKTEDERYEYTYSGTLTLIEYRNMYWAITAAHTLPSQYKGGIFIPHREGGFYNLLEIEGGVIRYDFCDETSTDEQIINDLTVMHFIGRFPDKNYFKLDSGMDLNEFHQDFFSWSGFPCKTAENFHKTKNHQEVMLESKKNIDGIERFTFVNALTANIDVLEIGDEIIKGFEDLKNVSYLKEAQVKPKGYSLKGMSRGVIFLNRKSEYIDQRLIENPIDFFQHMFKFIGIGVKHKDKKYIIGISEKVIKERLEQIIPDIQNSFFINGIEI